MTKKIFIISTLLTTISALVVGYYLYGSLFPKVSEKIPAPQETTDRSNFIGPVYPTEIAPQTPPVATVTPPTPAPAAPAPVAPKPCEYVANTNFPTSTETNTINQTNVAFLTNRSRASQGLKPLAVNTKLQAAAQAKADDMAVRNYFAHDTPEGYKAWKLISEYGYAYEFAGENLAREFISSEDMQKAWLASPTHRYNIMAVDFEETGVGIARGTFEGHGTLIVVQLFAKPTKPANCK